MVTGVCGPTMTANVIGAPVPHATKEAPAKSDRRSNKPIMEKRRRARINNCLNELKTLILDATKKDPARHSKLEKADILEKTVKHLQELQRQQAAMQQAADPKIINKFKAGFTDCANEVSRFPGLEPSVKRRLLQHLQNCINGVKTEMHQHQRQQQQAAVQQLHGQILPSPPSSPEQDPHHQQQYIMSSQIQQTPHGYFLPNGLQVIPTKLPNGSIALVLPPQQPPAAQLHHQQQQPPMLVPIPSRTASTGSASSHSSQSTYEHVYTNQANHMMHFAPPSPANSHEAMDYKPSVIHHAPAAQQQQMQQPLSLVTKKQIKEEEPVWRPW
ncbi:bHLH transcriptional repressor hairy [Musca autumnalis]|uniref:bHLH transcriptional repressor hairy n=1 Tax=Musca autumnalis TaxID=221902 RepID=UPI003CFA1078